MENIIEIISDDDEKQEDEDLILINDFSISIKESDYRRLEPGTYLNDNLIDFFLNLLIQRKRSPFIAFNSFFYSTLTSQGYAKVKSWYQDIDLFSKDYWLIPIAVNDHWILVIVTYPKHAFNNKLPPPAILLFDSIDLHAVDPRAALENFMQSEWRSRYGETIDIDIPLHMLKVPLQNNQWDCGVFILEYAKRFIQKPRIFDVDEEFDGNYIEWFDEEEISDKRFKLKNTILQLQEGIPYKDLSDEVMLIFRIPETQLLPEKRPRTKSKKFGCDS